MVASAQKPWWSYQQPSIQTDWAATDVDPLGSFGQGTWASNATSPFSYDQPSNRNYSYDYDPAYSQYATYDPQSGFTQKIIESGIQRFMEEEYPELYDFETGTINTGYGGGGTVGQAAYGQFSQDPTVYKEIEATANKYGIPANFLKAIITRESSGDWLNKGRTVAVDSRGGKLIHGYVGVFQETAESRVPGINFAALTGNRAGQIDLLGAVLRSQYDEIRQENPNYDWINVAAYHYSGQADGTVSPPEADGRDQLFTNQYMAVVKDQWAAEDAWVKANGGTVGSGGNTAGMGTVNSPEWSSVNQWDSLISKYAAQYQVPANLIKAIMRVESSGSPNARSDQGAIGLMQVMPQYHNTTEQEMYNPEANINKGAQILKNNFDQYGSWEMAAKAYLGLGGADALGTTSSTYWAKVDGYWDQLDAASSGMFGATPSPNAGPSMSNMGAIWGNATNPGGQPFEISQEFGPTAFSQGAGASMYEYSRTLLGTLGHPGLDIAMPEGTKLFSPVTGTVIVAGGSGYYVDDSSGNAPQTGELRIRMANGHEVVLGHMAGIHVKAGDQVTSGQAVGVSGDSNGAHLHLEYVVPSTEFGGTQKAIDPREALAGLFTGSLHSAGGQVGPGIDRPYTFQDLMRAGAKGDTIYGGSTFAGGGSTWNAWLQRTMQGLVPTQANPDTTSWQMRDTDQATGSNNGYSPVATGTNYRPMTNPYRWY